MTPLTTLMLGKHPWISGIPADQIALIGDHSREVRFHAGQVIFAEGEHADRFWLIWEGQIALVLDIPGRGTVVLETLSAGDCLGWSWLFPPYRWQFGAIAVSDSRAMEIDGTAVRSACDADPALCAAIYRRVSATTVERLQATRMRLLDLYGAPADHHRSDEL
jgi:CRP-like cAMP-binding protein